MTPGALDPITFEVLRSGFEYACERMGHVLQRVSFSPIIYDMVDFSNGVFDAEGELVGQAANCPVHLGAMHYSVRASVERFGADGLGPGDVVILNDPYRGGTHTPDVTMTLPVYADGELIAFTASRAHWTDLGGGGQAFSTHIAAEGLRLPPLKLVEAGELNTDLVDIIRNQSRVPQYVDGDVNAQLGALSAGEAELLRLIDRYGHETLRQGMKEVTDYTERMTRAAIARIPDGVYEAEDYADTDGFSEEPVRLRIKLTVAGDELAVDFAGTDPVADGAINSPEANTVSAVYYSLKFFLSPDAPANAGMYRPITISIPEDTWLNPSWPAPTIGCTVLAAPKVCAAVWQALAHAIPDRIIAPTYAEDNWFVASVADPEVKGGHVFSDLPPGGWGGTPFHDGMNVTEEPNGNCTNLPAETAELLFPIEYERYELRPDSGGPGQFRGGLGSVLQVRFDERTELSMECSRTRAGSPGVGGGEAGPPQRQSKVDGDGRRETIGGLTDDGRWLNCLLSNHPFAPGEVFLFESTGGGGWGDPLEREPAAVLSDVVDGYVSAEVAARDYGVVIDRERREVDGDATKALRSTMRARRRPTGQEDPDGHA